MDEFNCRTCHTPRYLWVLHGTEVEARTRIFGVHQGGARFKRTTGGYYEIRYFCRRCGQQDSMRITDPEAFPDPSEVLEDSEVEAELGYILGPGESLQS
ncbi:hypothetical protein EDL96_02835 [Kocuria soli]|uniref:Uncharacterized protein n=1 Tax=Kocuria soli TaxID=2485125 RepID=A0A3N3ZT41_9MICC|nr:hypothetical protein [Kocuria soli]ROZ64785.1 hypothetical protein EDL96_02835 [Kocuria soli]